MSDDDPLEDLYVDESEINKERLSEALQGIIGIDQETGEPAMLSGYPDLQQKEKVVAYLLSRRVALELDQIEEDELGLSGSQIAEETGVPQGTAEPYISENTFIVNESEKNGYYIPDYGISEAIDEIVEE